MHDIITIGSATQDVFLTSKDYTLLPSKKFSTGVGECFAFGSKVEVQNIFLDTGGGATNTAVTFANLGFRTACITRVGHDAPAREIREVLQKKHVDTSFIITTKKEHTAYSTILLTKSGERTVLVYRGASAHFSVREIPWNRLRTQWFYVSSLGGNMSLLGRIFSYAQAKNISIAWNPGRGELQHGFRVLKPYIQKTAVLIMNREEAASLELPKGECRGITVVTDGRKGAYVCDHRQQFFAPSSGHKSVNATGAGDAFGSAFVAGIIKSMALQDALRLAILNSGLVVTKMGAKNGLLERMPSLAALKKLPVRYE